MRKLRDLVNLMRINQRKAMDTNRPPELPFDQGGAAYVERKHWNVNPYAEGTWQHDEWFNGWSNAESCDGESWDWTTEDFKPVGASGIRSLRDLVMAPDVSKLTRDELMARNAMVELATWCMERLPLLEQGRKVGFRMALSADAISAIEAVLPHPDGTFVVRNILHVDG